METDKPKTKMVDNMEWKYKLNGNGNEIKMEKKTLEVNIDAMLFCYYLFML
jgi:hypothetical protein